MLQEFANCYQLKTGTDFDVKRRHIRCALLRNYYSDVVLMDHDSSRCLAHIINLATQATISARSKSKYYNGNPADEHLPEDLGANERDEIGIVRAICIKVRT
jgi:hypothetical protein